MTDTFADYADDPDDSAEVDAYAEALAEAVDALGVDVIEPGTPDPGEL